MGGLFDGTPLERPVTCDRCGRAIADCACPRDASGAVTTPRDQPARVRREKRRGKWVTVVTGLDPVASDLPGMLRELRRSLGAGGSVTSPGGAPAIEVQGDHADAVMAYLVERGYPAKRAGG
jgi:translation initiation factor 1